eukprot:51664-Rhodomonas_salina.1
MLLLLASRMTHGSGETDLVLAHGPEVAQRGEAPVLQLCVPHVLLHRRHDRPRAAVLLGPPEVEG